MVAQAVIYQIYPRRLADSDGDGVGDLPGITARVPYLRDLGVDAVWITPFYPSPMADAGYDVDDYRDIDPVFGHAGRRRRDDRPGARCSASRSSSTSSRTTPPTSTRGSMRPWRRPGPPERARYIFRDGRGPDGGSRPRTGPPCSAARPGPASEDGQWYLHLFAAEQPDLNWANREVRDDFLSHSAVLVRTAASTGSGSTWRTACRACKT